MGLIVDGQVSGKLPEQMTFAVNYPGYPSSMQRAVETLGGEEGLVKARSSEANYVELKFRPEDPYAHPAFGELSHSSDLVLRISRKAKKRPSEVREQELTTTSDAGNPEDSKASETAEDVRAEIVAKVQHTYSFEGMTDYQYVIAIHADDNRGHKRKGSQQERGSLLDMEQGEPMMLVPPLFSVKDLPEEIFLRPPGGKKPRPGLIEAEVSPEVVIPFALDFKIKEVPSTTTWRQQLDKSSDAYAWTELLANMFEERPIWAKSMLNDRLTENDILVTDFTLRSLLFRVSYYFGGGPFRKLWIKYGYDPRKDPESRKYQALDFRVPAVLREKFGVPEVPPSWKDLCSFKAVPHKKFTIFQMYDLQDDAIQAEINKPPERATCGESTGWYRLSTMQKMRLVVRMRFLALYGGEVARSLEDADRKTLNRHRHAFRNQEECADTELDMPDTTCRKQLIEESGDFSIESESHAIGDHADRSGDISGEDEPPGKIIEEEEDEEEEDEEDEEEMEDDEEVEDVHVQSQNDIAQLGSPVQGHIDLADNIPQSYLQALLGKFAFESDGAEHPGQDSFGAKGDDEEYTIFEQDEDEEDD